MKKSIFILAAAILCLMASCNQMSEKKYNDTVANMYQGYASAFTAKMSTFGSSDNKEQAMADLKSMAKTTDSCIGVMNGLKPSEDAKDFHQKVLGMFQLIKTDYVPAAEKLVSLKGSQDIDAYNNAVEQFNHVLTRINTEETATQAAQRAYASKVGMKIQ
ncbi:hypothetical protein [Taibaiella helva]|uniref:hypothetical protein n=1 Tax=Taibaiella helva TaxID=2301235 RepID=UPI000E56BFC6|nr:hypothetical protein [Taibaiella helva]